MLLRTPDSRTEHLVDTSLKARGYRLGSQEEKKNRILILVRS